MTNLSEHFTLEELVASDKARELGIDNTPTDEIITALTFLAVNVLEPARTLWGVPVRINSGYRCPELNSNPALGGSTTSEHVLGCAADCVPEGLDLQEAFDAVRASDIPYDQVIFEDRAWIHLGIHPEGAEPRREALTATGGPGHWVYKRV
jgi:zinc D-Ala-D-Ala carboxypeptidase